MSKFVRLSTPAVTKAQKEFLDDLRDRTGTSHAAHIRNLIQKDMDSKIIDYGDDRKFGAFKKYQYGDGELDGLTVRSALALFTSNLRCKNGVREFLELHKLTEIDDIGETSEIEILEWLNS